MYICNICGSKHKILGGLGKHVRKKHNISSKEYYDEYFKKENNGLCIICGKQTTYENMTLGYKQTCGNVCACKLHRKKLKEDSEKFETFRKKVIKNQKRIWIDRTYLEKKEIFDKISIKSKETIDKMTIEEKKIKFGWLNNLPEKEREKKINEILDKSLKKWFKNAKIEEKLQLVSNEKKYILGDMYFNNLIKNYDGYKKIVNSLTETMYRKYKKIINPNNLKRSRKQYHLDHKYSIYKGFINNIDPKIISSLPNLQILPCFDNLSKNKDCSINLDDLIKNYERFINEYYANDI